MTDEVNGGDADMELDEFENLFFEKEPAKEPEAEKVETKEDPEIEDDPLATEEVDTDTEAEDKEEAEEPEQEPEPEPEPKPKKKSALQTRIDELVAEAREAQRERDVLKGRLEAVEAREEKSTPKPEVPLRDQLPPEAPNPDTLNEKGEAVYPLGEFDPSYIRDLTRFTITEENKKIRAEAEQEAKVREIATEQAKLQAEWAEKIKVKEEEVPDFREKAKGLTEAFSNLDPQYGDYLATTIMQLDNGPDVLDYLSQNIGEARDIVASGPFAATLALGRLQAKLEKPAKSQEPEEPSNNTKVSEAPEPPSSRTRGAGGKFSVSPDTDDLDAFARIFLDKKS